MIGEREEECGIWEERTNSVKGFSSQAASRRRRIRRQQWHMDGGLHQVGGNFSWMTSCGRSVG